MTPTNGSRPPKSVSNVMIGPTVTRPALSSVGANSEGAVDARRGSTVAVDDEVGDELQGLAVLGAGEGAQGLLRGLGIGLRAGQRVIDTLVRDDQSPNLLDLAGI